MAEIKMDTDQEILREAEEVLRVHLGPAKATRFWIAWSGGTGDCLQMKETLFKGETVNSLYDRIQGLKSGTEPGPAE